MKNTIIIPYRNRQEHLDFFLENSAPKILLNENFDILIIEQDNNKLFNRGVLINIGFLNTNSNFIITHDVDLNPTDKSIPFYNINKSIFGIYTSSSNTLGGIVKISKEHFNKINGFPNNYWGWGCEDKALQNRAEHYDIDIEKNILNKDHNKDEFFKIFNNINDRVRDSHFNKKTNFEYHLFKKNNFNKKEEYIKKSGLNNIKYKIIEKKEISYKVNKLKVKI